MLPPVHRRVRGPTAALPRPGLKTFAVPARSQIRRTSLPMLEAMLPASTVFAQTAAGQVKPRFVGVFFPHGMAPGYWSPEAKQVIYDGFRMAVENGVPKAHAAILADERFSASILRDAADKGYVTACPAERSGQQEFAFEYDV